MFRLCTKRLAVSMFSLFLVEQKNNPVLKNLPIIKRGKLLGKLYRSLSPEDRAALEYRAEKTKAWKRSKKKKTEKNSKTHNKTGVHHNKQMSYYSKQGNSTPKSTTSNNANKAFSLSKFVRDHYQHEQQKYQKLPSKTKVKAHQRVSQIAHSWKKKNTTSNVKMSKPKVKSHHGTHLPYSSHKFTKKYSQAHKRPASHSSHSTTAHKTHKSLAGKHKTSATSKLSKKSHLSHRPKDNVAKGKSNHKKYSCKKIINTHLSKLNKQHHTHRKKERGFD